MAMVLTGCSRGSTVPSETALSMPPSPVPEQVSPAPDPRGVRDTEDGGGPGGSLPGGGEADGSEAGNPSEHCVMVAGGVTTAMLAPLTLWPSSGPEDLQVLERQILELRDRVPAELHDDFTALARSVEAPSEDSPQFDERALQEATEPIQEWLDAHCADG